MAKIIPSGVIQLPNFAELQYKLDRQKQSDEMAVARDLAQYKRQSGVIAPGAMPLVQQSFDSWQDDAKKYAADPSASNFAKLNSSYENYSQAHGYGKFLYDTVKERDAKYYSDPTKWNIKVDDYNVGSNNLLNNSFASLDELVTAASNIPSLSPAKKYEFGSAKDWAERQVKNWSNTYKDLDTKGTGKITPEQRDQWLKNVFQHQIAGDETALKNAVLSEAALAGTFGEGPITSDDINRVMRNPDLVEQFRNSFYERGKADFDAATPLGYKTQYDISEDEKRAARDRAKDGAEKIPKQYSNLTTTPPPSGSGFIYRIDNQPIKTSDGTEIVAFGVVDGVEKVQVISSKGPFDIGEATTEFRTATSEDKANMRSETGNAYQMYISQGKPLKSQTPAASQPKAPGFMDMPSAKKDPWGKPIN